jgi:hypothetical protein
MSILKAGYIVENFCSNFLGKVQIPHFNAQTNTKFVMYYSPQG